MCGEVSRRKNVGGEKIILGKTRFRVGVGGRIGEGGGGDLAREMVDIRHTYKAYI